MCRVAGEDGSQARESYLRCLHNLIAVDLLVNRPCATRRISHTTSPRAYLLDASCVTTPSLHLCNANRGLVSGAGHARYTIQQAIREHLPAQRVQQTFIKLAPFRTGALELLKSFIAPSQSATRLPVRSSQHDSTPTVDIPSVTSDTQEVQPEEEEAQTEEGAPQQETIPERADTESYRPDESNDNGEEQDEGPKASQTGSSRVKSPKERKMVSTSRSSSKKRKRESNPSKVPRSLPKDTLTIDGLREYIESSYGDSFDITMLPHNTRDSPLVFRHESDFAADLDCIYKVNPANAWTHMKTYKRFTIGDAKHSVTVNIRDCIYVKFDESPTPDDEPIPLVDLGEQWKAQVQEIRAIDGEHVLVLVAWLYRPEDLPGGRQPYHGKFELIPSNHLNVIDAMTCNGILDVASWDEDITHKENQWIYRQTFDETTKTLTPLPPVCIEQEPNNPDDMIIQCTNDVCGRWQHIDCLAKQAITKVISGKKHKKLQQRGEIVFTKTARGLISDGQYTAEVRLNKRRQSVYQAVNGADIGAEDEEVAVKYEDDDAPDVRGLQIDHGQDAEVSGCIIVSDARGKRESLPITCLFCEEILT